MQLLYSTKHGCRVQRIKMNRFLQDIDMDLHCLDLKAMSSFLLLLVAFENTKCIHSQENYKQVDA